MSDLATIYADEAVRACFSVSTSERAIAYHRAVKRSISGVVKEISQLIVQQKLTPSEISNLINKIIKSRFPVSAVSLKTNLLTSFILQRRLVTQAISERNSQLLATAIQRGECDFRFCAALVLQKEAFGFLAELLAFFLHDKRSQAVVVELMQGAFQLKALAVLIQLLVLFNQAIAKHKATLPSNAASMHMLEHLISYRKWLLQEIVERYGWEGVDRLYDFYEVRGVRQDANPFFKLAKEWLITGKNGKPVLSNLHLQEGLKAFQATLPKVTAKKKYSPMRELLSRHPRHKKRDAGSDLSRVQQQAASSSRAKKLDDLDKIINVLEEAIREGQIALFKQKYSSAYLAQLAQLAWTSKRSWSFIIYLFRQNMLSNADEKLVEAFVEKEIPPSRSDSEFETNAIMYVRGTLKKLYLEAEEIKGGKQKTVEEAFLEQESAQNDAHISPSASSSSLDALENQLCRSPSSSTVGDYENADESDEEENSDLDSSIATDPALRISQTEPHTPNYLHHTLQEASHIPSFQGSLVSTPREEDDPTSTSSSHVGTVRLAAPSCDSLMEALLSNTALYSCSAIPSILDFQLGRSQGQLFSY